MDAHTAIESPYAGNGFDFESVGTADAIVWLLNSNTKHDFIRARIILARCAPGLSRVQLDALLHEVERRLATCCADDYRATLAECAHSVAFPDSSTNAQERDTI